MQECDGAAGLLVLAGGRVLGPGGHFHFILFLRLMLQGVKNQGGSGRDFLPQWILGGFFSSPPSEASDMARAGGGPGGAKSQPSEAALRGLSPRCVAASCRRAEGIIVHCGGGGKESSSSELGGFCLPLQHVSVGHLLRVSPGHGECE